MPTTDNTATVINPGANLDPNTGLPPAPAAPLTNAANALGEQETYLDEWAKDPTGAAPVRTWVDPAQRTGPDGEYLSAWYDSPAQTQANPSGLPAHSVAQVAPDATTAAAAPAKKYHVVNVAPTD
jgi:hypothetical protein